jgi:hypothetical protein
LLVACAGGTAAQVPGNQAPPFVTVGPAVRATTSAEYEIETVIAATRTGRVLTAFFDGETIADGLCPGGPDMHRSVIWDHFLSATGPGDSVRFRGPSAPPAPTGGWCFTTARSAPQRDPIAVADHSDGTIWVGAFQVTDNESISRSSSIWVGRLDPESMALTLPINAVLYDQPYKSPTCGEPPFYTYFADKPVLTVGRRTGGAPGRVLYLPYVERWQCEGFGVVSVDGCLKVARSTTDGATWSVPLDTGVRAIPGIGPGSQPQSPSAVVLDNGRLLVTYNQTSFQGNIYAVWSDAEAAVGSWRPVSGTAIEPVVIFDSGMSQPELVHIAGFASRGRAMLHPSTARSPIARVGGFNHVYVAYHRIDPGGADNQVGVYLAHSADGGATWPTHVRVPVQADGAASVLADQFGASIAVDSLGGINVIWWEADPVSAPDVRFTLYYARYAALAAGAQPHALATLFTWDGWQQPGDLGDYQWITAVDQSVHVASCGAITDPGPNGKVHVVVRRITLEEP